MDEAVPDARLVLRAGGGKCRCDGSLQNRSGGGRCRRPTQDRRAAVWNNANALCGSCAQEPERGLSARGVEFVARMEELGIHTDVSHISDAGFWDVLRRAKRPVVASHSNARAICPHRRNLTDDMFRAIRDTGGVVGINLYADFVGGDSMEQLIAHIERFLSLDGEKTVALGGDLDGCEALAAGFSGVQDVAKLYQALEERGYPQTLLEDIFWNNWRRIL